VSFRELGKSAAKRYFCGDDSEPATPSTPTTPADDGVETDPNIPTLGDVKFELSPDAVLVSETSWPMSGSGHIVL